MRGSLGRRRCSQDTGLAQATMDGAAALAAWTAGWRSEDDDSGFVRADLTLLGGGFSMGLAGPIWAPRAPLGLSYLERASDLLADPLAGAPSAGA
jgi:hypothetical protein